jgi:hypothetical protein
MSSNDEQNTEIEVLKSIYWEDFKGTIVTAQYLTVAELEPVEGWPSFEVHLKSQNEYSKPDEYHLKDLGITLKVTYNADYPQTSAPSFEIQELKELETEDDCKQTALTIEKENLMKILIEQVIILNSTISHSIVSRNDRRSCHLRINYVNNTILRRDNRRHSRKS